MASQAFHDSQHLGDRYQIQQQLGKKAGRQTWLAKDVQTQNSVVVKLLTFSHDFEWNDLKLFEREAKTLQALSHPAIPRYLDYFDLDLAHGKGFALVQTYIPAQSLEQHIKSGRTFSESEVKQLARELLEILAYLHDRQPAVIHRDIKPSNILLVDRSGNSQPSDSEKQVYLVDFGSVQTAAREGGTMTVVGTYGYMPPEQFGGRATPASDLYSLGATLIYLVTGQHPADLPQNDLQIEFEQAANLSPSFTSWLKWMTEPGLSKRPPSAREALQGLDRKRSVSKAKATSVIQPVRKPMGTLFLLNRGSRFIEILMPSQQLALNRNWSWVTIGLIAFFFSYFLLFWLLYILITFFISSAVGRTRLRIDLQDVTISREAFGWTYTRPQILARQDIWKLELSNVGKNEAYEVTVYTRPRLYLWIGTRKCEIWGTEAELRWLAYELSDWLDLPVM